MNENDETKARSEELARAYADGYETAAREIADGVASDMAAWSRGLYPNDQHMRIKWDMGYDAACAAYRIGEDPNEIFALFGPEISPAMSTAALVHAFLGGEIRNVRPDPRYPTKERPEREHGPTLAEVEKPSAPCPRDLEEPREAIRRIVAEEERRRDEDDAFDRSIAADVARHIGVHIDGLPVSKCLDCAVISADDRAESPTKAESPDDLVSLPRRELACLLNDNARLNAQISEVQAANTALVEERRKLTAELERYRAGWDDAERRGLIATMCPCPVCFECCCERVPLLDPSACANRHDGRCACRDDRTAMLRDFMANVVPPREWLARPGLPSAGALRFRVRLILDEVVELLDELYDDRAAVDQLKAVFAWFLDLSQWRRDLFVSPERLAKVAQEATDVAYTIEHLLVACGIDGTAVFRVVHSANMAKRGGAIDASGKIGKPPGWSPPDVAEELERQRLNKPHGWLSEKAEVERRRKRLAVPRKEPENAPDDENRTGARPEPEGSA